MKTEVIMVVGKNPLDDKYGFDAVSEMRYGSFIPDMLEGEVVSSLIADRSAGSVVLTVGSNTMGTKAAITLESGATIDLSGVAGVYTAGVVSVPFAESIALHLDGVQNMVIGSMADYVSAQTTSATTITVTLDNALTESTLAGNWSVDINAGTDNPVVSATIAGSVVTLTVANPIVAGQVILVSHTRSTEIDTITASAVTNNVA